MPLWLEVALVVVVVTVLTGAIGFLINKLNET
jgi:preprotein translocase subunit Sss1